MGVHAGGPRGVYCFKVLFSPFPGVHLPEHPKHRPGVYTPTGDTLGWSGCKATNSDPSMELLKPSSHQGDHVCVLR